VQDAEPTAALGKGKRKKKVLRAADLTQSTGNRISSDGEGEAGSKAGGETSGKVGGKIGGKAGGELERLITRHPQIGPQSIDNVPLRDKVNSDYLHYGFREEQVLYRMSRDFQATHLGVTLLIDSKNFDCICFLPHISSEVILLMRLKLDLLCRPPLSDKNVHEAVKIGWTIGK
jgi:hypothetical protein